MTYFFGINIKAQKIDLMFDFIRIILESDFARKNHITLRGPYNRKPKLNSKWLSQKIGPAILSKPDTFFFDDQNTVFLRCELVGIDDIWYKPDYPAGTPHLSIYDGPDRQFAWQVLMTLREFPWQMMLEMSDVKIIEKKSDFVTNFIFNQDDIDQALDEIGGTKYTVEQLKSMKVGQRILLLKKTCAKIHELASINHPSSTPI